LQWVARAAAEADSVEGALKATLDEVCRCMAWPLGHVLKRVENRLVCARIWHLEKPTLFTELQRISQEMSFAPGEGLPGRVLASGQPLWIIDVTEDSNFPRARAVQELGVRAALAFPVLLFGEVVAVLEFFSPDAVEPDQPLLDVMATIGTQLARVMERTRAQEALKQSELRFRSVAETAHDAIITADEKGRIVTWNRAAERMFGHREEEVRGQPLSVIIPERLRQRHIQGMARVLGGGERRAIDRTVELDGLRRDGSEFPLELSLATWAIGGERFFTGILRDITERREQGARLERSEHAAVEASRSKSLFLANMSHELRTPLNSILGFVQLMKRDSSLSAEQRASLAVITRSGEHLLGLINSVLSISKIEAGEAVLHASDFNLKALLASLCDMFHAPAQARGLELRFELPDALPLSLHGDEGKLRQVLINLIGNALKFTERGGALVRVDWRAGRGRFSVEDSGRGIPPADLERVLQPFVQLSAGEGAGLGLAISRDFVRLLGGELRAESQPAHGSRFDFEIDLPLSQGIPARASDKQVKALAPGQPELRILVVDNAEDNRRLLVQLLRTVGFVVDEAADGQAALTAWEARRPQLIWMDMRMPVLDGYQATLQIRQAEKERSLPRTVILALTASAFDHSHSEIIAAGCDDLVLKPFRESQIFEALERWLGARFVREEPEAARASVLSLARLGRVPPQARAELVRALEEGDDLAARRVAEGIEDSDLGAELLSRIRNFEFDQLLALLERV
jgi:two-component system sensor histidine kinase/response regulator